MFSLHNKTVQGQMPEVSEEHKEQNKKGRTKKSRSENDSEQLGVGRHRSQKCQLEVLLKNLRAAGTNQQYNDAGIIRHRDESPGGINKCL